MPLIKTPCDSLAAATATDRRLTMGKPFQSSSPRFGSVKTLRHCCFLFCWSVLVFTVICLFGGPQTSSLYEYGTDYQTNVVEERTVTVPYSKFDATAYEEVSPKAKTVRASSAWNMEVIREIEKNVPSLPLDFWGRHKRDAKTEFECAQLPSILDLEYSNEYWQRQRTSNGTFELFGAYLDNRKAIPEGDQFVRILGMVDRVQPAESVQMFCQLWYDDLDRSFVVPLDTYNYIWYKEWGNYVDGEFQPFLFSCRLPKEMRNTVPAAVSLVENKCDLATNCLRVTYNKPLTWDAQEDFAVCVKGLDFPYTDLSVRLVEWIELLTLLGAKKIFFYELQVHPNIRKVLSYYEQQGRVEVQRTKLTGGKPNFPGLQHLFLQEKQNQKRQQELIPYNDCLYRNMYRFKFLALLDIDEVIMPTREEFSTWHPMMRAVQAAANASDVAKGQTHTSYAFRNAYFLDKFYTAKQLPTPAVFDPSVPEYMHMVRHTSRAAHTPDGYATKCFHRTDLLLTVHNHFGVECLSGFCQQFDVSEADAQLNHYRKDCTLNSLECRLAQDYVVEDRTIERYQQKLVKRSLSALLQLGLVREKQKDHKRRVGD